ncbi:sodium/glutamate symporter [Usitatibacter palustris]|uniref:Sodium/glutamate symporter n=1 Tax=Usitatibacter palustris TaxID=2732487 RepID=A0A6M4H8I6_9PROT|nr:sodium/glutamate symporter [Usitatibacter palustris]QJR14317.1 Sodium/glutamate symporter [Usitatibacter palustris]
MTLDPLESLLAALACLLIGAAINRKVWFLSKYNIPDPITGGLLFAAVISILMAVSEFKFSLNATMKPTLLLMFFAGVGMSADLRLLKQGGKALAIFLVVLFPFILLQNVTGIFVAKALDLHPLYGIIVGSITLVGGHGTGAAYAERFAEVNNLQSVMELSMTSATFGLILGGIAAGPVAQYLISKHKLKSEAKAGGELQATANTPPISTLGTIGAFMGIVAAVIAGQWLGQNVKLPITIPSFLWCMVIGVAIRNLVPFAGLKLDDRASDLISGVSLSLFLVMTMMALNLVEVALSAGPLLLILVAQVAMISAYTIFVTFRLMGRDYEAAVTSAAFIGFSMGSTATAIANMQAIVAKYGPAPQSFLIVPLAGAFFVDLMNALILTGFLSLGFMGGGP